MGNYATNSLQCTINDQFSQGDHYGMYAKLEQTLLLAATTNNYSGELKEVAEFHKDDFNSSELETELNFSQMNFDGAGNSITFQDICKHMKSLPTSHHVLISQVVCLLKLILLMPTTNAMSE